MNSSDNSGFQLFNTAQQWVGTRGPLNAGFQTIIALIVLFQVLLLPYRLFFHPLAHIPGPFWARISGWWRSYLYLRGTWHDDILEIHRQYGRIVRIAPDELSVVDETVMRRLYGHGHDVQKTEWYRTWEPPGDVPALFAVRDKKVHAYLKKRGSGAYSMSAVLRFEEYIQGCLDVMMVQLEKHADGATSVDMTEWTSALAFDVVGELAFGAQLGHLRTGTDVMDLRKNILTGFWLLSTFGHFPGQARLFNSEFIQRMSARLGIPHPLQAFQEWSEQQIRSRMDGANDVKRDDMLSHFIRMKNDKGEPPSFEEVLIEGMSAIGAGADTIAASMRSCLYYICIRPEVYRKLQKEIDDFYSSRELVEPVTYQQTQQMPYTVAVCKEAMRLHPAIVFQLLRIAPAGLSVDGKHIPPGTAVGVSAMAHNRDAGMFGHDSDDFKPERWLEDEQKARYMDSVSMTFGGTGSRTCIGRNIALVEIHKFIVQLLRNFEVSLVNPDRPWHITSYWFAYQHNMQMRLKLRPGTKLRGPSFKGSC